MYFLEDLMEELYLKKSYISMNLQFFADGASDKTEEPTAKKLQDARKEGQVAKSQELVSGAMLFALFLCIKLFGGYIANSFMKVFYRNYGYISTYSIEMPELGNLTSMFGRAMLDILLMTLPVFAFAVVIAFALNVFQVKWKVTGKPLQPKLNRLNPVSGFKKIFSMDKLFELLKAILKIVIIFWVAYSTLMGEIDTIKILYDLELIPAVVYISNFVINLGIKISAVYLLIGLADFIYQKFKFKKDMKMSKQEVKDEYKQQEGDPQVKGRIKSKMRESSMRRMMQKMPDADVVITNPTHFACAIQYDKEKAAAPVLIAKGADHLAQKLKDIAKEHNVPIVENKPLARMLYYNVDIDAEIPQELYQMTAEVLAYVYQLKNK
jgi:flagellar biosynthetic protein FlhB